MTCNCRTPGECWHFSPEEWAEMRKEAAKVREEMKSVHAPPARLRAKRFHSHKAYQTWRRLNRRRRSLSRHAKFMKKYLLRQLEEGRLP